MPIAEWLHCQTVVFRHFPGFTRRNLNYGALGNLLLAFDLRAFEDAVLAWLGQRHDTEPDADELRGMAIDGSCRRGDLPLLGKSSI